MSALAHLINPPQILPPTGGRVVWGGRNKVKAPDWPKAGCRSDGSYRKGTLMDAVLSALGDETLSVLEIADKLDANNASVSKALYRLTSSDLVVRCGATDKRGYLYSVVRP